MTISEDVTVSAVLPGGSGPNLGFRKFSLHASNHVCVSQGATKVKNRTVY